MLDSSWNRPMARPRIFSAPGICSSEARLRANSWMSARLAMASLAADNLIVFLIDGKPVTPLNPEVLRA